MDLRVSKVREMRTSMAKFMKYLEDYENLKKKLKNLEAEMSTMLNGELYPIMDYQWQTGSKACDLRDVPANGNIGGSGTADVPVSTGNAVS